MFSFFVGILLFLIGMSLILTIVIDENSQNMFFGCIGGLIAFICGLSIIQSLVVLFICIVISYFFISKTIFVTKSDIVKKTIIYLSVILVLIGILIMSGFNFYNLKFLLNNPLFLIIFIFLSISSLIGTSLFIKYVININPNNFDGGCFDSIQNDTVIYSDKKTNNRNRFLNYKFISSCICGLICFIAVFICAGFYNFYYDSYKTVVIDVSGVNVGNGDNFYYCNITVDYKGNKVTFPTEEQTVRELPKVGDKITVYKVKNGNIKNFTSHDKRGIFMFLLFGVLLEIYAISSVFIRR